MSFYYLISTSAGLIFSFLLACGNGQTSSIPKSSKEPTDKPETYLVSDKPKNQNEQASLGSSKQRQTGQTAGVSWEIPGRWEIQPPRMMRVATYLIPKTTNSEEPSECAVFFFGQGQGGSAEGRNKRDAPAQRQFKLRQRGGPGRRPCLNRGQGRHNLGPSA